MPDAAAVKPFAGRIASLIPQRFAAMDKGQVWELATRIVNVVWVSAFLLTQTASLYMLTSTTTPEGEVALLASGIAARLASALLPVRLRRRRRVARAAGGQIRWAPSRFMALAGDSAEYGIHPAAMPEFGVDQHRIERALRHRFRARGYAFTHLNRSATITAEARSLVTTGPYRVVRHPVYLFEAIGIVGIFLPFNPLWAIPMFMVQFLCQVQAHALRRTGPDRELPRIRHLCARTRRASFPASTEPSTALKAPVRHARVAYHWDCGRRHSETILSPGRATTCWGAACPCRQRVLHVRCPCPGTVPPSARDDAAGAAAAAGFQNPARDFARWPAVALECC